MATPSSGAISLDQINVEAGGSSGSTISINDVQIRFLDSKSANATSSFDDFYGIEAGGGIMSVGGTVTTTHQAPLTIRLLLLQQQTEDFLESTSSGYGRKRIILFQIFWVVMKLMSLETFLGHKLDKIQLALVWNCKLWRRKHSTTKY